MFTIYIEPRTVNSEIYYVPEAPTQQYDPRFAAKNNNNNIDGKNNNNNNF